MARRPSASAGMPLSSKVRHTRPPAVLLHQGEDGGQALLLAVHGVDKGLAVVPPQGGLHGFGVGGVQLQGQAGDGLDGLHRLGEHRRLVQAGQAHVHVQDVGPGLLLLEGLAQHIVHVPGPEGGLELLLPGGVDALPDDHRVPPVQGHRLAVGGDEQGVLPGDLRQGEVLCGLDQGSKVGGGGAAASPQEGGHGGQLRHLGGVVCRGHVVDGLSPLTPGQARVGLEEEGDRGGLPQLAEYRGHLLGAQAAVETDDVHPQPFQQGHCGLGGAAGEELPAAVKDEAGQDGQAAVLLGGHHCRLHLVEVAHGLDENTVCPGLLRGPDGGGKAGHGLLKVQVPVGPQELAGGADVGADVGVGHPCLVHGGPDVGHGGGHHLGHGAAVRFHLGGGGAEGVGGDKAAARLQIGPVDGLDGLGVLHPPHVGQAALRQAGGLEHAAHAPVQIQAAFSDGSQQWFHWDNLPFLVKYKQRERAPLRARSRGWNRNIRVRGEPPLALPGRGSRFWCSACTFARRPPLSGR